MLRDSRIVHIIDLLGELRELLLVIDQAGDTAPAILLKLAKEKAEESVSDDINSVEYASNKIKFATNRTVDEGIHQLNKQGQKSLALSGEEFYKSDE